MSQQVVEELPVSDPNSETLAQLKSYKSGTPHEPELPKGAEAAAEVDPVEDPESPPPAQSSGIVIDGQEFATEKEAYQYAQKKLSEVETEKLLMQARQEGMEAGLLGSQQAGTYAAAAPEPVPVEDDMDAFYENPTEYLRKKTAAITEQVSSTIQSQIAAKALDEKLWGEFFAKNPDLDGFKEDCQHTLNAHLDTVSVLAKKDRGKAMDFLASKTREKFHNYIERQKPRKVLPNQPSIPSSGGNPGVTHHQNVSQSEDSLDFVSQLRNMRNS